MQIITLNGLWDYIKDPNDEGDALEYFSPAFKIKKLKKMQVPSNWEIAGLKNFCGTVWFIKDFSFDPSNQEKDILLQFKAVDYFAKVWLNGEYIGSHEGYFQPFEFDITNKIKKDFSNYLAVKVEAPFEPAGKNGWPYKKKLIKGIFSHHDVRPGSWSIKYGQSHGTGGIWNDVSLIICSKIRISGIKITPILSDNFKKTELEIESFIENTSQEEKSCLLEFEIFNWGKGLEFCGHEKISPAQKLKTEVRVLKGINIYTFKTEIKEPLLWWPWDHGKQDLYLVRASIKEKNGLEISHAEQRFGIRDIKLGDKKSWIINGRKIFIRGSNIIPEEYLSKYSIERIKQDVKLIKSANLNAVRVHAHINRKELYDEFDEAGILVWQDFPLQWEYSDDQEFIGQAVIQIKNMVCLLHNNPSIVLWCCHNEPIKSGKEIDPALYNAVQEEDKTRIIIQSSSIDEHPYPGWYWGDYKYFISAPGSPFPTEFGAQALSNVETLKKIFSKSDLWPPNWIKWAFHDFQYDQTFFIAGVEMGKNINEFVSNSQNYQAELIQFSISCYRHRKASDVTGLFHFLMLEPWPAISYSILDYFRKPKAGFFALKKAMQPIIIIPFLSRKKFGARNKIEGQFWLVNDYFKDFQGAMALISFKKKNTIMYKFEKISIDIEKDSCKDISNIVYSTTKGLRIPDRLRAGRYNFSIEIFDKEGNILSSNSLDIAICKTPKGIESFNADLL